MIMDLGLVTIGGSGGTWVLQAESNLSYHGFMLEVCVCVNVRVCVNTLISSRRERGNLTIYRDTSSSW